MNDKLALKGACMSDSNFQEQRQNKIIIAPTRIGKSLCKWRVFENFNCMFCDRVLLVCAAYQYSVRHGELIKCNGCGITGRIAESKDDLVVVSWDNASLAPSAIK